MGYYLEVKIIKIFLILSFRFELGDEFELNTQTKI
jgi:hypothetical protein